MVYYGLNKFLESILVGIDRISSQDVYDICFRVIESTTQHMFFWVGYMEQTIRGCQDFFRFGWQHPQMVANLQESAGNPNSVVIWVGYGRGLGGRAL